MTRLKPAPRFVFLLNRAQRAITRWVETRPDAWEGVSAAQAGLLFYLESHADATIGELAGVLTVAPAAVTNLSKRMQASGLIARVGDEHDGRMTRLQLTEAGRAASGQARRVLQGLNAQLSAGFTDAELLVVARWLEQAAAVE